MANTDVAKIPVAYRIYFLWCDPIVLLSSVYMVYFTPDAFINAFIPIAEAPPYDKLKFLLHMLAAAYVMLAFLCAVLQRYSQDIMVWKILQAGIAIYDAMLLVVLYQTIKVQGRLSSKSMRLEDYTSAGITGTAFCVRTSFILGSGEAKRVAKRD